MKRKITIEDVQKLAAEKGGICLSTEYLGSQEKLQFKCIKNHEWKSSWSDLQQGKWCKECYFAQRRMNINYINEYVINKYNGKCLSTEYKNAQEKLIFECHKK